MYYLAAFIIVFIHYFDIYWLTLLTNLVILVAFPIELYFIIKNWYHETLAHFVLTYAQDLDLDFVKNELPTQKRISPAIIRATLKGIDQPSLLTELFRYLTVDKCSPSLYTMLTYNYYRQLFITRARKNIGDVLIPIINQRKDDLSTLLHREYPGVVNTRNNEIYTQRLNGRTFITINMIKANWTIVSRVFPSILKVYIPFQNISWEDFAKKFTSNDLFIKSRSLREACVGGASNERRELGKRLIYNKLEDAQKCITHYIGRRLLNDPQGLHFSVIYIKGDHVILLLENPDEISDIEALITNVLNTTPYLSADQFRISPFKLLHKIIDNQQAFLLTDPEEEGIIYDVKGCPPDVRRRIKKKLI